MNQQADSITQDEHNNIIQDLTERHKEELSELSHENDNIMTKFQSEIKDFK